MNNENGVCAHRSVSMFQAQLTLLLSFLLSCAAGVQAQSPEGVYPNSLGADEHRCGAEEFMMEDVASRGAFIPQTAFPPGQVVQCGGFNLYFEDIANSSGQGFDGPFGPVRVNTACQVFNYLSGLLIMPPTPVDIYIFTGPIGGGLLAQAGPRVDPAIIAGGGVTGGEAYVHITTGIDPSPTTYDGNIQVDFTTWTWLSDPALQFPGCGFDLYTVLLHEATHVLGWISYLRQDGANLPVSLFTMAPWNQGAVFSEYDARFLWWGDIFAGGPFQKIFDPILMTTIPQANCLVDDRVWMYGLGAGHLDQPINSTGAGLSHFRQNPGSFTARAFMAPGFVPNCVMDPGLTNMGQMKRTYALQELRALQVLGYQFNPAFLGASSINGSDQNGALINANTPPYSDDVIGYLTGNSPSWPDYEITVHGTINNCDDFFVDLANRPELHDDEGDPIRVFPNSLYNVRGCGDGGNNHLQLSLTSTPAGDIITFTPRQNFYGRAQFGFHLWDGHEMGDYVVYTVEVLRDACFQCPATNLVLNGDYESGSEVALLSDEAVVNSVLRDGKEGRLARGLHFSDGHPRNDQGTVVWIGFFGGGSIIDDCVRECPTTTPMNDGFGLHSVEVNGPPGPVDHPTALTGSRYNVLGFWNNGSLLCSDLQNCHRYRLTFNVNFDESNQVPFAQYPLLIGFADDVQDFYFHPYPYNYSFNTSIQVPATGTGWHQFAVEFDYCGVASNILNIEAPSNFSDDTPSVYG